MVRRKKDAHALAHDVIIIALGIVIAVVLSKYGIIDFLISLFKDYYIIASFITGIFFTSVFTIAPSSVAFASIAENFPLPQVAIWGGLGAMCGDLILFFFIKDRFYDDLISTIKPKTMKHILRSLHFGFLKWLSPLIGAFIIASPLPDELGVALLGMSKIRIAVLIPLSFTMNILGIYILIFFATFL